MKQKILVTGGTGYIGSHTAVELITAGYDIIIADNLSNSSTASLDGIEIITGKRPLFIKADLSCKKESADVFSQHRDVCGIIHFAALKAVGESLSIPTAYYRNNLVSLMNIIDEASKLGKCPIIFSSSATVYGEPDALPINEKAQLKKALSPYGNTKKICEEILEDAVRAFPSISAVALRYFNPVGAHDSAMIGELPSGIPNNLMPFVTQTAAGIRDKLRVFGNDYSTPDGSCLRDYIHVVDLAKAHVAAVKRLMQKENKSAFEVFNIGTGAAHSVLEMISSFERVTGVHINHEIAPRREGDIERMWADTSLANKELGWKAERTLDDMLLSAWNWEKKVRGIL